MVWWACNTRKLGPAGRGLSVLPLVVRRDVAPVYRLTFLGDRDVEATPWSNRFETGRTSRNLAPRIGNHPAVMVHARLCVVDEVC